MLAVEFPIDQRIIPPVVAATPKQATIKTAPTVSLSAVTNITANPASSGGAVMSDGGSTVTSRGVCWSINQNPTVKDR